MIPFIVAAALGTAAAGQCTGPFCPPPNRALQTYYYPQTSLSAPIVAPQAAAAVTMQVAQPQAAATPQEAIPATLPPKANAPAKAAPKAAPRPATATAAAVKVGEAVAPARNPASGPKEEEARPAVLPEKGGAAPDEHGAGGPPADHDGPLAEFRAGPTSPSWFGSGATSRPDVGPWEQGKTPGTVRSQERDGTRFWVTEDNKEYDKTFMYVLLGGYPYMRQRMPGGTDYWTAFDWTAEAKRRGGFRSLDEFQAYLNAQSRSFESVRQAQDVLVAMNLPGAGVDTPALMKDRALIESNQGQYQSTELRMPRPNQYRRLIAALGIPEGEAPIIAIVIVMIVIAVVGIPRKNTNLEAK